MSKSKTTGSKKGKEVRSEEDLCADAFERSLGVMEKEAAKSRGGRAGRFVSMDSLRLPGIVIPELPFQYLIGRTSIPQCREIDIIGQTGVGKSTLAYGLFARTTLMMGGGVVVVEGEGKPLEPAWVTRILDPDPAVGARMRRRMMISERIRTLAEMERWVIRSLRTLRGQLGKHEGFVPVPMHLPLLLIIDPYSKFMAPADADSFYLDKTVTDGVSSLGYGDEETSEEGLEAGKAAKKEATKKKAAKKKKEPGESISIAGMKSSAAVGGGAPQHAQFASRFSRKLAHLLESTNTMIVIVHHQTEKLRMNESTGQPAGMPSAIPADVLAASSVNKIGGRGFDQSSSLQLVVRRIQDLQSSSRETIGKEIGIKAAKSSIGVDKRDIRCHMMSKPAEGQSVLDFSAPWMFRMLDMDLFNLTVKDRLYYSKDLELSGAAAGAAYRALMRNEEACGTLRELLGIQDFTTL